MNGAVDRFDFRQPLENDGWTQTFCPCHRRSPRSGSVALVAAHEIEAILDELDERRWDMLFAKSPDALKELAAQADREDDAGLTEELDPDRL